MKFAKVDAVTIVLSFLVLFFAASMFYLDKKDTYSKNLKLHHEKLELLSRLNHDFNHFLSTGTRFKNYDDITSKMKTFENVLDFLIKKNSVEFQKGFLTKIKTLQRFFEEERSLIEHQKSLSATTAHTLSYLFDLQKSIQSSSTIELKYKKLTNSLLFSLLQLFSGMDQDEVLMNKALAKLSLGARKTSNNYLEGFHLQATLLKKHIILVNDFSKERNIYNLAQTIQKYIHELHNEAKKQEDMYQVINKFLLLISIALLVLLITLHLRSLKQIGNITLSSKVFEHTEDGIVITDKHMNIISINQAFEKITAYTEDECLGKRARFLHGDKQKEQIAEICQSLKDIGSWSQKIEDEAADGTLVTAWLSVNEVKNRRGHVENYIFIYTDLYEIISAQDEVDYLAFHDPLTALPNRVFFEEQLSLTLQSAEIHETKFTVLFIDLDRFKIINDTLGHHIGDELLKVVAHRLKHAVREHDILARLGGDEFVVLLNDLSDKDDISRIATTILNSLSRVIHADAYTLNTSASIGVSIYPNDASNMVSLLKNADLAMYQAKENGKNRFEFYEKYLTQGLENRLDIEQELRYALVNEELCVYFQPQYDLLTKRIVACEALLRWNSRKLGSIGPDTFIPIAEDTGLIVSIGDFVFKESCRVMRRLKDEGLELPVMAVNISVQQFREKHLVQRFISILKEYDLEASCIEIEITERYLMEYTLNNLTILDELQDAGFTISIDDFGTGYSSMSYLKKLPIDTIKVDKSFVDDLPHNNNDAVISNAIIVLSNALNYNTVAEGIETQEQEDFLREHNCRIGQGYLFSPPLKEENFISFLKN